MKSDEDKAILEAVRGLGWHDEPSLPNRWPHNTIQERYHGTYKSVWRAVNLQAGTPKQAWDHSVEYASTALAFSQKAPLLPWEKDASGNVLALRLG